MRKTGFTLIELIGVVALLAVIAIVAIPSITKTLANSGSKQAEEFQKTIELVAESYVLNNLDLYSELEQVGGSVCVSFNELYQNGYLKKTIQNPETKEAITLQEAVQVSKLVDLSYQYTIFTDGSLCQ